MYDVVNMYTGEVLATIKTFAEYAKFADDFYNKHGLVFHIVSITDSDKGGWVEVELLDWDGVHYNIATNYD